MLMSSYKSVTTPEMLVRLWCHESKRVFEDRLINAEDHAWFKDLLKGIVSNNFQMDWYDVVPQVNMYFDLCIICAPHTLVALRPNRPKLRLKLVCRQVGKPIWKESRRLVQI